MTEKPAELDPHLVQLILSLQTSVMINLGKIASPEDNKVTRNLPMAQAAIDSLTMLQVKTKGNLTEDEYRLLGQVLYQLRLNYVDEANKDTANDSDPAAQSAAETEAPPETADPEQK